MKIVDYLELTLNIYIYIYIYILYILDIIYINIYIYVQKERANFLLPGKTHELTKLGVIHFREGYCFYLKYLHTYDDKIFFPSNTKFRNCCLGSNTPFPSCNRFCR